MKNSLKKLTVLLNLLLAISLIESFNQNRSKRSWDSICSLLSCQFVLNKCVQNSCLSIDQCRNCVQTENQNCVRCVDSIINEQFSTTNGTQSIICDAVNSLHETTCNFFCRMKEKNSGKCEQTGGYQLCTCYETSVEQLGSLLSKKILNEIEILFKCS